MRASRRKYLKASSLCSTGQRELDMRMEITPRTESVTVTTAVPLLGHDRVGRQRSDRQPHHRLHPVERPKLSRSDPSDSGCGREHKARADLSSLDTNGAIMGERAGNTSFLIDGLENNDDFHGGVFQAFTQDAIQEFEVIDTGFKAEFGNGSAGIVNVVSKSGSNSVHGDAFLFVRNDALDSSDVSNSPPPALQRYDYGGTIGGPVRRDKAWIFGSVELVQQKAGAIFPPNVPASLSAGENFSQVPETHDARTFGKYTQKLTEHNEMRVAFSWTRANLAASIKRPAGSSEHRHEQLDEHVARQFCRNVTSQSPHCSRKYVRRPCAEFRTESRTVPRHELQHLLSR